MNLKHKIKDTSTQIRGVSYSPKDVSEEASDEHLVVLRANNITENGMDLSNVVYVKKKCISETQILRSGDILIVASSGSKHIVGRAVLVKKNLDAAFGAFCKVIRPKANIDHNYLGFYFRSPDYRNKISHASAGANINNIRNEDLDELDIPLPSLAEQQRIAALLDASDALRRKDQELLKKYDELAQAIFIDMFGDPVRNEKGWETDFLNNLLHSNEKISYGIVQPGDEVNEGIPVIRVGDFESMSIKVNAIKKVHPVNEIKHAKTRLIGDEILIACVGSIGKIALVDSRLKGFNIVRATARVRTTPEKVNRYFLAHLLSHKSLQNYFLSETRTVSQPTLNIKQIELTKIVLPPLDLQNQFASAIEKINQLKEKSGFGSSERLFEGLLQKSFK